MAKYESEPKRIQASVQQVFSRLDNLEGLRDLLEKVPGSAVPEDKRAMLEGIEITPDTITIPGGPVGSLTLRKSRTIEPELIELKGEGTPVPLTLSLHLTPQGEDACEAKACIDLEIPAMLKPMISGPMNKMIGQFGDVLGALNFE